MTPDNPLIPPTDRLERAEWIVRTLPTLGTSLARIAADLGVARQVLQHTLSFPVSSRGDAAIAQAMRLAPQVLWPERYTEDGTRIDRRRKNSGFALQPQPSRTASVCNEQRKAS